jgi:hypothetical protein
MASYVDPKLSDIENIEAIRYHYSLNIQRAMLNIHMKTVSEALDLLKRIEGMENREHYQKGQSYNVAPVLDDRRYEHNRNMGNRNQGTTLKLEEFQGN